MVISMYRSDLPEWAEKSMQMTCTHCGSYIADNSDTGVTTARWCINPKCPGHMAYKADELAKYLGVKGVGPKTLERAIVANKFTNHFQFIGRWFVKEKPLVALPEIAIMACIEGYGESSAYKELGHFVSFQDYFNTPMLHNQLLVDNKELLLEGEKYFNIKPPLSPKKMFVMATGSFHNYNNRNDYFRVLNEAYGMYINVIQTGKRKTGVSYLIREHDAVDHSKTSTALENGIPIVTPTEFLSIIASMCPYINEDDLTAK